MYKKRKLESRYYVIIIVVMMALILGIMSIVVNDKRQLSFAEKAIKDTTIFFEKVITSPINFIENQIKEIKEKNNLYEKYKKLKAKVDKEELNEAKYEEVKKQVSELKKILEINQTLEESSYLNASVVNRNIGYWYNTITIDKGSQNGVKVGMAVIVSEGLIGEIVNTTNFSSTVKLLTSADTNNKISIKIGNQEEYVYGLLTGYEEDTNTFIIEGISENKEIKEGSLVTTTGLGNSFPSGILIGKVESISTDNFDLARTVKITPSVDFDDISYVTILKRTSEIK